MVDAKYWLGIDTPAVYEDSKKKYVLEEPHPFGFPKSRRGFVKKMRTGDRIINYITELHRFFAVWEITEEHFSDANQILGGTAFPECVEVRPVKLKAPKDGISVHDVLDTLEIFKTLQDAKRQWGVRVKASAQQWPYSDGETILKLLRESSNL